MKHWIWLLHCLKQVVHIYMTKGLTITPSCGLSPNCCHEGRSTQLVLSTVIVCYSMIKEILFTGFKGPSPNLFQHALPRLMWKTGLHRHLMSTVLNIFGMDWKGAFLLNISARHQQFSVCEHRYWQFHSKTSKAGQQLFSFCCILKTLGFGIKWWTWDHRSEFTNTPRCVQQHWTCHLLAVDHVICRWAKNIGEREYLAACHLLTITASSW